MGILVRIGTRKAFLRRGEWKCADAELEQRLNLLTTRWIQETGGPPMDDHDHERTVAEQIAGQVGGTIAMRAAPSLRRNSHIFISRRQLQFDF